MESFYRLSEVKKEEHPYFIFFKNLLEEEEKKNYINDIFNLPKLPLIGFKKANDNNSHLLGKLLSLVSFQIDICQGKDRNKIEQAFSDFVLPENINDYLNIEEVIEIDNNTDDPNINLFFMPKRKLNFYFIISDLPIYPEKKSNKNKSININNYNKINIEENNIKNDNNDFIDFFEDKKENKKPNKEKEKEKKKEKEEDNVNKINIIEDKKDNLNKINIINDNNDKNKNNKIKDNNYYEYEDYDDEINEYIDNMDKNKNKIKNKFDIYDDNINNYDNNIEEKENTDNNDYNDFQVFNLIPHFFYINDNEKNLLEIKNLIFDKQITLFALENKKYNDIDKDNNKSFIDINNLRAESSNIVLVNKNNFVIEKDNLKFYLNTRNDLSQFYLIYTSDEDDHHSVFYYITCNNLKAKNKMKDLLNKSITIKDMIYEIEKCFGKNEVTKNLKKLFLNK